MSTATCMTEQEFLIECDREHYLTVTSTTVLPANLMPVAMGILILDPQPYIKVVPLGSEKHEHAQMTHRLHERGESSTQVKRFQRLLQTYTQPIYCLETRLLIPARLCQALGTNLRTVNNPILGYRVMAM